MKKLSGIEITIEELKEVTNGKHGYTDEEIIDMINKKYNTNIPYNAEKKCCWDVVRFIYET